MKLDLLSKNGRYKILKIILPLIYLLIFSSQLNNRIAPNNHNLIITLTAIENWGKDGIENHNFNIIHSWGNEGDLNVHYYKRVMNKDGRNYFVSYPPLSFILIYPFLKCLPTDLYPIGYKFFGGVIHILTYILLLIFLQSKTKFQQIFGAATFLFFPSSIVLSGMYYPEQLIILIVILFAMAIKNSWSGLWLAVLSFLMVYADWLGIIVIGGVFMAFKLKRITIPIYPILLGALIGGSLLIFQYSLIDGIEGLIHGLKIRYL